MACHREPPCTVVSPLSLCGPASPVGALQSQIHFISAHFPRQNQSACCQPPFPNPSSSKLEKEPPLRPSSLVQLSWPGGQTEATAWLLGIHSMVTMWTAKNGISPGREAEVPGDVTAWCWVLWSVTNRCIPHVIW